MAKLCSTWDGLDVIYYNINAFHTVVHFSKHRSLCALCTNDDNDPNERTMAQMVFSLFVFVLPKEGRRDIVHIRIRITHYRNALTQTDGYWSVVVPLFDEKFPSSFACSTLLSTAKNINKKVAAVVPVQYNAVTEPDCQMLIWMGCCTFGNSTQRDNVRMRVRVSSYSTFVAMQCCINPSPLLTQIRFPFNFFFSFPFFSVLVFAII